MVIYAFLKSSVNFPERYGNFPLRGLVYAVVETIYVQIDAHGESKYVSMCPLHVHNCLQYMHLSVCCCGVEILWWFWIHKYWAKDWIELFCEMTADSDSPMIFVSIHC